MKFFPTVPLLLLSPFVLVPLGLRLAARGDTGPAMPELRTLAKAAPFAAIFAALSYIPPQGIAAALISVPWLLFTALIAAAGVARVLSRKTLADPGIGVDAGLMFVVVGGAWLTISRAGGNPLGFSDAIVQLTAVHFHYAGFALPIVAGIAAARVGRSVAVPAAVIAGVPLTAIGITAGGWLEWGAATLMAFAGLVTAAMLMRLAMAHDGVARTLLGIAGIALTGGMGLALWWAWSVRFGWTYLGLENMAATHGALNALGFGLIGLIGLTLLPEVAPGNTLVGLHLGRPNEAHQQALVATAVAQDPTNPIGLLDRPNTDGFKNQVWTHRIEHGDFDLACTAIRQWQGHKAAGIAVCPPQPEIRAGETLAVAIPVGPISVSGTSRIVDVVDTPDRYGFTYATMPHHPVDGEESFIINRSDDGELNITVTARWRSAMLANDLCPPVTRFLQNRAINQYLRGIAAGN